MFKHVDEKCCKREGPTRRSERPVKAVNILHMCILYNNDINDTTTTTTTTNNNNDNHTTNNNAN